jgi:hypothetical protein
MKFYERGDPRRALDELGKFPYLPAARKMDLEINNLRNLCFAEISRRSALQEVQAQTLLQDAQRHFFMGQGKTSIEQLEKIVETYPKTPVADQAREFLEYARTRMEVERLENASGSEAMVESPRPQPGLHPQISTSLEREIKQLLEQLRVGNADDAVDTTTTASVKGASLDLPPASTDSVTSLTKSPATAKESVADEVR